MQSDYDLKVALVAMLPETVEWRKIGVTSVTGDKAYCVLFWKNGLRVLDNQLLHLCARIEETLTDTEYEAYGRKIILDASSARHSEIEAARMTLSAPWDVRVRYLAHVKGIKITNQ